MQIFEKEEIPSEFSQNNLGRKLIQEKFSIENFRWFSTGWV